MLEQDIRPETEATTLSPEFLTGGTVAGLEKLRARLLDLTNRNRLLNFRHTAASSIRIVDVDADGVFTRLMSGEELLFLPVIVERRGKQRCGGRSGSSKLAKQIYRHLTRVE
jgi:hypothetical protein